VSYAEIVASVASLSAGPGTRQNIDEFTRTTAGGVETIGGAQQGKAIIILNPAEPPMIMRDTIFCAVGPEVYDDQQPVVESVHRMVEAVQQYVPGYRLLQEPQFDPPSDYTRGQTKVSVFIEVEGAGDFLPSYSGNLDIMTAAATRAGEGMARAALGKGTNA
jgi:acetaldehyde dehydrogenase